MHWDSSSSKGGNPSSCTVNLDSVSDVNEAYNAMKCVWLEDHPSNTKANRFGNYSEISFSTTLVKRSMYLMKVDSEIQENLTHSIKTGFWTVANGSKP